MRNSAVSLHSERAAFFVDLVAVASALTLLVAIAVWWCFRGNYILYYGDAQAHLNISRGIFDSRTPGYDQLGTVWLPMLHVICLPFVQDDWLWSTGLAGSIPVAACFVIAGTALYFTGRHVYGGSVPALIVLTCFASNPNVLYLAAVPMTEMVFLAGVAVLLFAAVRDASLPAWRWFTLGVVCCWTVSLTRYDGWFLLPFAAFWFGCHAKSKKVLRFLLFGLSAALAPAYWIAHNWYEKGNALDFYNGPYAPIAIQGRPDYPGYHDWLAAFHYYGAAAQLCSGWPLILLGLLGLICSIRYRNFKPLLFLGLTPFFYVWSMHSSGGTPIHVPNLWPHSYYNTRYGIAVVALCSFAAGAIPRAIPPRFGRAVFVFPLIAMLPWIIHPAKENWITWKESQVNSDSRRIWTAEAASFLQKHYRSGQGILSSPSDLPGIYCKARIHLSETLNIGNGPAWLAATSRPDLFHPNVWAIAEKGDSLANALDKVQPQVYVLKQQIPTKDDPTLWIFSRTTP